MKAQGILILSHVGFSFVDQLANQVEKQGVERYILASLPEQQHLDRLPLLNEMGEWFNSTEQHELCWNDVLSAIEQLQAANKTVVGCICVWEGYRELMARANQYLGIEDITPDCVALLTNKFDLRKMLYQHNLSRVLVEPLTEQNFLSYQQQMLENTGMAKFIKPFRGIASFGTFRLTPELRWQDIVDLQLELQQDLVFKAIFASEDPFIIEDFIHGHEFSFEILVENGQKTIVAIHEKGEVSLQKMTTLENACVCPPVNLHSQAIDAASVWLDQVFSLLAINSGCFHVEAKFDGQHWEIIEINPRVGGSLISPSVEYFTAGHSLLTLWIQLLLQSSQHKPQFTQLLSALSVSGDNPSPNHLATFFRVFFGEVGTIASISEHPGETPPLLSQVFVKAGDHFSSASKENFVGQALWGLEYDNMAQNYQQFSESSAAYIQLDYTDATPAIQPTAARKALLIIDFNLSRREDVAHIKQYTHNKYDMDTVLIRANPSESDKSLADVIIDLDPLQVNFVEQALAQIDLLTNEITAGLVFSDNAVHSGALLLKALSLRSDCASLAENAFCKHLYRVKEHLCKDMLEAQQIMVPNMQRINSLDCLEAFISNNADGVVIKPTTEGNNRGVILLHKPTNDDIRIALDEVQQYIGNGVIAEQMIPFTKEFSFDGIGSSGFITEKFNVAGRYPVEFAQLVPADITPEQKDLITRAGRKANMIVGQSFGPFHNEVRIADDLSQAAVIEANRRPAGMKIWTLASKVFGQDLYGLWVDSVIENKKLNIDFTPTGSAMSIMLQPTESGPIFDLLDDIDFLFGQLQHNFATKYPQDAVNLEWMNCTAIAEPGQVLHVPAKDNSDFVALLTISASWDAATMKTWLPVIQACWAEVLGQYLASSLQTVA